MISGEDKKHYQEEIDEAIKFLNIARAELDENNDKRYLKIVGALKSAQARIEDVKMDVYAEHLIAPYTKFT